MSNWMNERDLLAAIEYHARSLAGGDMSNGRLSRNERDLLAAIEYHARSLAGGDMSNGRLSRNERDLLAEIEYQMRTLAEGGVPLGTNFNEGEFPKRSGGAWVGATKNEFILLPLEISQVVTLQRLGISTGTTSVGVLSVPAGKVAVLVSGGLYNSNTSSAAAVVSLVLRRDGTDYIIASFSTSNLSAGGSLTTLHPIVAQDGDEFLVNVGGGSELTAVFRVVLLPDTNSFVKSALTLITESPQTIYTCPSGKRAWLAGGLSPSTGFARPFSNPSGGSVLMAAHKVLSGGSPDVSNRFLQVNVLTQSGVSAQFSAVEFAAGDQLVVVSGSIPAGLAAIFTMLEVDA